MKKCTSNELRTKSLDAVRICSKTCLQHSFHKQQQEQCVRITQVQSNLRRYFVIVILHCFLLKPFLLFQYFPYVQEINNTVMLFYNNFFSATL